MINKLRRQIVDMVYRSGEGHIASAFSILDIIWILYDKVLNITPLNVSSPERDRFILSKGHGCLALYVVLAEKGFITQDDIINFTKRGSILGGHPDYRKINGVEASTGSLGHGAAMSVGMAMALKIQKNPAKVYCLIGDGELNEGSVWEAALLAAHHKLNNLIWIIDYNHSTDRAVKMDSIWHKFESFDWIVQPTTMNSIAQFLSSLNFLYEFHTNNKPMCLVVNTIKGKGVSFMEGNQAWHHKVPTAEEYNLIMEELNEKTV
jgi:transketolase